MQSLLADDSSEGESGVSVDRAGVDALGVG
jgi:hypothetical protein